MSLDFLSHHRLSYFLYHLFYLLIYFLYHNLNVISYMTITPALNLNFFLPKKKFCPLILYFHHFSFQCFLLAQKNLFGNNLLLPIFCLILFVGCQGGMLVVVLVAVMSGCQAILMLACPSQWPKNINKNKYKHK